MNRRVFFGRIIGAAVAAKVAPKVETIGYVATPSFPFVTNGTTITTTTTNSSGADVWVRWSNYDGVLEYSKDDRNTWSRVLTTSPK